MHQVLLVSVEGLQQARQSGALPLKVDRARGTDMLAKHVCEREIGVQGPHCGSFATFDGNRDDLPVP